MPTYNVRKARLPTDSEEFVRIPKRRVVVLETVSLAVTLVLLAINAVLSVYSWWGDAEALGMGEGTREGLTTSRFGTPYSPAPWTFAAWIVVFAIQFTWLTHACTYACRQKVERAISPLVYPAFWIVCSLNIGYVYSVGHLANELSLALIAAEALTLCFSVGAAAVHLRSFVTGLKEITTSDKWLTHLLTINGLALYATWAVISTLFHIASVLKENSDLHGDTITTCLLSLLGAFTVSYFLLEATILDRYLRYVFTVYPAVMWWLGGLLDDEDYSDISRNTLFALVLLVVVGGLLLVHLVLMVVFSCTRLRVGGGGRDETDGVAMIPY